VSCLQKQSSSCFLTNILDSGFFVCCVLFADAESQDVFAAEFLPEKVTSTLLLSRLL
jgi:hypothetical protein